MMGYEKAIRGPEMRYAETMDRVETAPWLQKSAVGVFFTCVACGTVEEIRVPREEGLPPKVYWECLSCRLQDYGTGGKGSK